MVDLLQVELVVGDNKCSNMNTKVVRKKKKKEQKFAYIQEWGTYSNETIVSVGMTAEEILDWLKKNNGSKKFIDFINKDARKEVERMISERVGGLFLPCEGASLLWLCEWKNNWEQIEILVHEVHHAVQAILGRHRNMMQEDEALAYQQQFLFREIRRKLQKLL